MSANFFKQIEALNFPDGLFRMAIQTNEGKMTVSILADDPTCTDKGKNLIEPLTLTGTAEELDNEFFGVIAQPIQETIGLLTNMTNHQKSVEQARLQSQIEADKAKKEKEVKEARKKEYDTIIKEVEKLASENKFSEALVRLPDPAKFPDQGDAIRKLREQYSAKAQPSLFS